MGGDRRMISYTRTIHSAERGATDAGALRMLRDDVYPFGSSLPPLADIHVDSDQGGRATYL